MPSVSAEQAELLSDGL